jgi:chlorophyllide a reductase subunit Z
MYREFGRMLCEALDRPYLQAPIGLHSTTKFLRKLGELLDLDPEPFIQREKHTTIKPLWDLWRSVTQDFFAHRQLCGGGAPRPMHAACASSSKTEMGMPCTFAVSRLPGAEDQTTTRCVSWSASKTPLIMFGSYNERMYLAEAAALAMRPRTFPLRSPAPSSAATPARRSWVTAVPPT